MNELEKLSNIIVKQIEGEKESKGKALSIKISSSNTASSTP